MLFEGNMYVSSVGKGANATLVRDSAVQFRACVLYPHRADTC